MYRSVLRQILVRDNEGGVIPFDPELLQTRLAGAFQCAGLTEESYVSDDIVLALEYTLRRAPRTELIFSNGEIDAAVVRILESSGFPEAAHFFRQSSASEQLIQLSPSPETIAEFLQSHLACSPERLEKISDMCAGALKKLDIEAASLHLILELARHYERESAENDLRNRPAVVNNPVLTSRDIAEILPEAASDLLKRGILQISGVSPLFPGIRFFFSMENFAAANHFSAPVTELELYPALYRTAAVLESARAAVAAALELPEAPPCLMTIPDMFDFLHRMVGCTKADTMAAELAAILCSEFKSELYQLSFD